MADSYSIRRMPICVQKGQKQVGAQKILYIWCPATKSITHYIWYLLHLFTLPWTYKSLTSTWRCSLISHMLILLLFRVYCPMVKKAVIVVCIYPPQLTSHSYGGDAIIFLLQNMTSLYGIPVIALAHVWTNNIMTSWLGIELRMLLHFDNLELGFTMVYKASQALAWIGCHISKNEMANDRAVK